MPKSRWRLGLSTFEKEGEDAAPRSRDSDKGNIPVLEDTEVVRKVGARLTLSRSEASVGKRERGGTCSREAFLVFGPFRMSSFEIIFNRFYMLLAPKSP